MAERSCCPVAGIGVHLLTPASNPRSLLDLLGLTDEQLQEVMAKDHPYGFIMGHNRSIPFNNYKEAAKALMERNLPQIVEDKQSEVVFLPETHLPIEPRVVDMQGYSDRKKKLDKMAEENPEVLNELDMKSGSPVELTQAKGDLAEKELVQMIKDFFAASPDKEVVVYQGPQIRKPGKGKGQKQENDVVIINKRTKTVSAFLPNQRTP